MKVRRQQVGTVEVLTPLGALVDQDAESFATALRTHAVSENPRLVVAMSEVPYMDSHAIQTLLDAADHMAQGAVTLKLAGVTPTCREILELTGTAGQFSFFEDVHDAVRSFL